MKGIKFLSLTVLFLFSFGTILSCKNESGGEKKVIIVLFENDVHCGDGAAGYDRAAGLRNAIAASDTAYCFLVSSGDFSQGSALGTLSDGGDPALIMNRCGYDAVAFGNHEFDYGMDRFFEFSDILGCPTTCVNLTEMNCTEPLLDKYVIVNAGDVRIAFIGVLTPEAEYDEEYAFFDNQGRQTHTLNGDHIFEMVQNAVDNARSAGADYVIALAHLGEKDMEWTSTDMIGWCSGIDAVLDGHTHTVIECDYIPDRTGRMIPRSQTGSKFENLGKLRIAADGNITVQLMPISSVTETDPAVTAVVDSVNDANAEMLGRVVGTSEVTITLFDEDGKRQVRRKETNAGDFVADAFRYLGEAEIGAVNGGGVRDNLQAGDVTYGQLINMTPYGNLMIAVSISGADLVKVLNAFTKDARNGVENGDFPCVSGIRYVIETSGGVNVLPEKVEVLNAETGEYEALDVSRKYSLGTTHYCYEKYAPYAEMEILKDGYGVEYEALCAYLTVGLGGHIGSEYATPQGRITFN